MKSLKKFFTFQDKPSDIAANQFLIQCLQYTALLLLVVWVLGIVGIFIVDIRLMSKGILTALVFLLLPTLIVKQYGLTAGWVKYSILFLTMTSTTILGIALTYHKVLLSALPLLYSIQYSSKKVIYYTYTLTVFSLFFIVLIGYRIGLCDANMLLLTVQPASYYMHSATGTLTNLSINPNPELSLILYYVLPRAFILLLF